VVVGQNYIQFLSLVIGGVLVAGFGFLGYFGYNVKLSSKESSVGMTAVSTKLTGILDSLEGTVKHLDDRISILDSNVKLLETAIGRLNDSLSLR
jgi:hypothetical protein